MKPLTNHEVFGFIFYCVREITLQFSIIYNFFKMGFLPFSVNKVIYAFNLRIIFLRLFENCLITILLCGCRQIKCWNNGGVFCFFLCIVKNTRIFPINPGRSKIPVLVIGHWQNNINIRLKFSNILPTFCELWRENKYTQ